MLREIIIWPDTCLKRVSEPVTDFGDALQSLLNDMVETMLAARGAGLAAVQVGFPLRAVTLLVRNEKDGTSEVVKLVNPRIVERKGVQHGREGCLSLPGYFEEVKRAQWVKVEAVDEKGARLEIEGDGYLARALQHELEHLDGIVFTDHVSLLKRNLAAAKFKKAKARGMKYVSTRPEPQDFTRPQN